MMCNADWLIPICLMLLGAVPFVSGVLRIVELGGDPRDCTGECALL